MVVDVCVCVSLFVVLQTVNCLSSLSIAPLHDMNLVCREVSATRIQNSCFFC